MCGRFTLDATASEISQQFNVEADKPIPPRYNIAPSQLIISVIQDDRSRSLAAMKWGLIPSWVKSLDSWKGNLINARVETIDEKPSFKGAFKYRPCLIPVTGFYEWSKDKQPYYFKQDKLFARLTKYPQRGEPPFGFSSLLKSGNPPNATASPQRIFALAGLWEHWSNGHEELVSCTIITTKASKEAAKVHHRSPLIIPTEQYDTWLGELEGRKELLANLPETDLQIYPVSKIVNSPKNDRPECIEPIAA